MNTSIKDEQVEAALSNCPFCGKSKAHYVHLHGVRWGVLCAWCDTLTDPDATTKEEAARHWNTRFEDKKRGLDDGPMLPAYVIKEWKMPLVIKAHKEGLSARACARVFDISHETAAQWVKQ